MQRPRSQGNGGIFEPRISQHWGENKGFYVRLPDEHSESKCVSVQKKVKGLALRTGNAAPPPGTPPTCGATPASATSPTASAAATYDDPRVGPPAHTRPRPAPAPFSAPFPAPAPAPAPSRAPTAAAPPVRLGPARQGPLALGPGGGAGGAAFRSRARAGRVSIACCAPGLAAALGLLALDADDSRASLRKFLEHLSGTGKAIGVLTSGGRAQGQRNLEPIKSQHLAPSFYQRLAITSQLPFLWICTFWTPVVRRIVQCMTFGVTFGADIFHV
ncbi:sterile alpha motif domain-containing protein 1-like [Macaca nemestrina]|uniref:sterile alpha motif domain-containing protein 1-like n=1 Tax=Macaca nemestrina TaxID=9545 RepID=UPI0039B9177B